MYQASDAQNSEKFVRKMGAFARDSVSSNVCLRLFIGSCLNRSIIPLKVTCHIDKTIKMFSNGIGFAILLGKEQF